MLERMVLSDGNLHHVLILKLTRQTLILVPIERTGTQQGITQQQAFTAAL